MAGSAPRREGRVTSRLVLAGAGGGIAGYVLATIGMHLLWHRFPVNPYDPDAWTYGAVFVGILAAAVVFVLGVAPELSRRRSKNIATVQPDSAAPDRRDRR